jgi:hypothetical protein
MTTLIERNSTDPLTGYCVKKIFVKTVSKKTKKVIWHLKWVFNRHKKTLSIADFYKQNSGKEIRITFSGISPQTTMLIPEQIL